MQGSTIGQEASQKGKEAGQGSRARKPGKDAISGSAVKTQIEDKSQPTPR